MPTAVNCATVNDLLARNDSLFGAWIHQTLRETSPWYVTTPKEAFPEGTGYTMRDILIEGMTTASDESDWTAITASDGNSINPLSAPTLTSLAWGQSYTNWSPSYKGYITPCISLDDLKFDHMVTDQVSKTVDQLSQVTDEIFSNRARFESGRLSPMISSRPGFGNANGIVGITDTTVLVNKSGLSLPTGYLHQSQLDRAWEYLLKRGAGSPESRANMADGMPVMTLVTSRSASDNIINASGIRDDFRWGDPGELLKPLGVQRVYRGFAHLIDPELPRFDLVNNALVRRLPWTTSSADSGTKRIYNTAYEGAGYELSYIKPMNAYACAVIKDSSAKEIAGASWEDHPYYYTATAFWHNVKDNSTNILGKLGRWILIAANASHPHYPYRGLGILSKRCPTDYTVPACTYGA